MTSVQLRCFDNNFCEISTNSGGKFRFFFLGSVKIYWVLNGANSVSDLNYVFNLQVLLKAACNANVHIELWTVTLPCTSVFNRFLVTWPGWPVQVWISNTVTTLCVCVLQTLQYCDFIRKCVKNCLIEEMFTSVLTHLASYFEAQKLLFKKTQSFTVQIH